MSLFKVNVRGVGGLGATAMTMPIPMVHMDSDISTNPHPVSSVSLPDMVTVWQAMPQSARLLVSESEMQDMLGVWHQTKRQEQAGASEPEKPDTQDDGKVTREDVLELMSAISPEVLPFAKKLIALALDGQRLPELLGIVPTDILTAARVILEWLSEEAAKEAGHDVAYFRYLIERMVDEPVETLQFGFGVTVEDGDIDVGPRIDLGELYPLESIRFSVLQGKQLAGIANVAERDELRVMLEERRADVKKAKTRYQFQARYNLGGGRSAAETFFDSLSGPDLEEVEQLPMEKTGYHRTKEIGAYGMALNAAWRSTTDSAPDAVGLDISYSGRPKVSKKFKYHPNKV
ncbi:MAG: hypothetical protein ACPG06_07580 [Alphaproteobacteria bacterium]